MPKYLKYFIGSLVLLSFIFPVKAYADNGIIIKKGYYLNYYLDKVSFPGALLNQEKNALPPARNKLPLS